MASRGGPCVVVVEITSPSTRRTDQYEKRDSYSGSSTPRAYFVVEQGQRPVDRWWRGAIGGWRHEVVVEAGTIDVPCPTMTLSLDEIGEGRTFPSPRRRRVRERAPAG